MRGWVSIICSASSIPDRCGITTSVTSTSIAPRTCAVAMASLPIRDCGHLVAGALQELRGHVADSGLVLHDEDAADPCRRGDMDDR